MCLDLLFGLMWKARLFCTLAFTTKMATSFKQTHVTAYPRVGEKITTDTIYWKNLDIPITKKEFGAISHIDFCSVDPFYFAVTNSTKVQIFSPKSLQPVKTLTRFRDLAYSGTFRSDGKLVIAGCNDGQIRLFDVDGKSLLRVFKGHKGAVHTTRFLSDKVRIGSGSDDNTVKVWDIPTESEVVTYKEHQDYVRCGVESQASSDFFLTGSYDHTVKLFDLRSRESVLTVHHGSPVESILMFPGGGIFLSAGGNVVKVWDALAGGKLLAELSDHHKTVTCLSFGSNYQRLFTGSLDRHVKIYDIVSYKVVHTLDSVGAILSLGVSPDDNLIVTGTAEGFVSIQKRKAEVEHVKKQKKASYKYHLKGKTYVPPDNAQVIEHKRKNHLEKYDKLFKAFDYSKALDAALQYPLRRKSPEVTISVIKELIRRGGIKTALSGRDEESLKSIVRFLQKNMSNPNFMSVVSDVANLILDIYPAELGHCSVIEDILKRLKETVDQEVAYMTQLFEVMGTMDTLFSTSQTEVQAEIADVSLNETIKPSQTAASAL